MRLLFILLLITIALTQQPVSFKDCNFSQFDYFSHFSLGQNDELNRTFNGVNNKITYLDDVQLKNEASVTYKISQAKANFRYLDGKQTAEVIGFDIIYVKGGKAQTNINFNWSKDQLKGTGQASCLTDVVSFSKLLYLQGGFMTYKLADYKNITFYNQICNIERVDPVLQSKDIDYLTQLFNQNRGTNLKTYLSIEVAKYYSTQLNNSLYDERQPINNHSEYNWTNPTQGSKNLTINYTLLPTGAHLNKLGLFLNFVTEITDDEIWKCGATVPSEPKDPSIYGGIQEYLSLSILQNTVRFAISHGVLNTILNRQNWQSKVFQFYAGDLYEIIPSLANKFYADTVVQGTCNATNTDIVVKIQQNDTFSLSLGYDCQIKVGFIPVTHINIDLKIYVQVTPNRDHLNFHVRKFQKFAHFKDQEAYRIHDIELANLFLNRSLQRLYESRVFGSGWKIYARDYPKVLLQNGYLFIYDAAGRV